MDSLSQLALGASVAAMIVPAGHRRAALLVGAMLGTLPDLDVLPLSLLDLDPVETMTWHRSASHSLFVLPLVGWLIWQILTHRWKPAIEAPRRWFWAIQLALITHPLLDATTIYGTQLWWPLPVRPVMGGSLFIIDPLYTLPLLIGCVGAWAKPASQRAKRALVIGVALSTAYIGWSLIAQAWVERIAARQLEARGWGDASHFVTPAPLNTFLWRVVVMTPTGFAEGYHSLVADQKSIQFRVIESDARALGSVSDLAAVNRLTWFNHGFMKAEERDGRLVVSDLRMGAEPDYVFRFAVAEKDRTGDWHPITPEAVEWPAQTGRLNGTWTRLWNEP